MLGLKALALYSSGKSEETCCTMCGYPFIILAITLIKVCCVFFIIADTLVL